MNRRTTLLLSSLMLLTLLLSSAMGTAAGVHAAGAGTGPDDARLVNNQWQPLNRGDRFWYEFQYAGDGSPLEIRLEVVPQDGASFEVWTPEEVKTWRNGSEVQPIGRGSPDANAPGVLVWRGNFPIRGTYYVVVEHAGSQPGTRYYLLSVQGDGVTLAKPAPAAAPSPKPAAPSKQAATPAKVAGKLVFQTAMGGPIYTINADGSGLQRVADGMDPSWSPDGKQIAFNRWQEPRGVWVANADGSNARRVFDWSEPRWTSWSPDGQEILFSRITGGRLEAREFCFRGFCFTFPASPHWTMGAVRPADGSFYEPTPPDSRTSRAPDWSPDGSRVAFADVQGVRVQNLDGSASSLITDDAKDTSPVWSPDGNELAFVHRQHDHWEIYAVGADGANLRRLTTTPAKPNGEVGNSASPAWSPDGRSIAFLTDRSGQWEIWVMSADGSRQRPMFASALDGLTLDYAAVGELAISWSE